MKIKITPCDFFSGKVQKNTTDVPAGTNMIEKMCLDYLDKIDEAIQKSELPEFPSLLENKKCQSTSQPYEMEEDVKPNLANLTSILAQPTQHNPGNFVKFSPNRAQNDRATRKNTNRRKPTFNPHHLHAFCIPIFPGLPWQPNICLHRSSGIQGRNRFPPNIKCKREDIQMPKLEAEIPEWFSTVSGRTRRNFMKKERIRNRNLHK